MFPIREKPPLLRSMTLFTATLGTSIILLALGLWLTIKPFKSVNQLIKLIRSPTAALVTMVPSIIWFSWEIWNLGEADFGNYKGLMLIFFLAIGISSFFTMKDFLSVRGAAIFGLMLARILLDAAFMQEPQTRLFLVILVYAGIVLALYMGTIPFRARDWLFWLKVKSFRTRMLGGALSAYGVILLIVAITY